MYLQAFWYLCFWKILIYIIITSYIFAFKGSRKVVKFLLISYSKKYISFCGASGEATIASATIRNSITLIVWQVVIFIKYGIITNSNLKAGYDMKNIKFNIFGLLLFILVMIPNFIWYMIKAPNDVLRAESITPKMDLIASLFQVIMVICLCFSDNKNNRFGIFSIISIISYFMCWTLYYFGMVNNIVIIGLCLLPCLSFLTYEIKIKNWIAIIPTMIFTILHLLYGVINFI